VGYISKHFHGRRSTNYPLVIVAILIALPEVLFIWTLILFTLALFAFLASTIPYLTIVVLGALSIVFLLFLVDGQVRIPNEMPRAFERALFLLQVKPVVLFALVYLFMYLI
jgi:hypothetical protein